MYDNYSLHHSYLIHFIPLLIPAKFKYEAVILIHDYSQPLFASSREAFKSFILHYLGEPDARFHHALTARDLLRLAMYSLSPLTIRRIPVSIRDDLQRSYRPNGRSKATTSGHRYAVGNLPSQHHQYIRVSQDGRPTTAYFPDIETTYCL